MATQNRDVELGISVTTAGSEDIKKLKSEIEELAKQGGAAAPAFDRLADELDRLGAQAQALETFDQIGRDIEALSLAENTARRATAELSVELYKASQTADGFREAQQRALTEIRAAQQTLTTSRIALAEYKNSTEAASASSDVYRAKVRELSQAVIDARKAINDKAVALRDAKQQTREAEAEETKLERAYNRSVNEANKLTAELGKKDQAQRDQVNSLRQLGVETDNLRAVDESLLRAMVAVQTETEELVAEQQRAAQAARQLAEEQERLAEEAKRQAQSYVNFWVDALNRREEAEKQAAAATKAAADEAERSAKAIQSALGTVGVRSAEQLRQEIEQVRASLKLLGDSGTLTGRELDQAMQVGQRRINELERQIREATGQLTLMDRAAGLLKTTVGQFAAFFSLTEIIQRLGQGFFTAAKQIEAMRLALTQVYGDARVAGQQIDFLRQVANGAGISIGAISDSFIKFSASTRAANMPLAETNALFAAVTRASGVLGLSGERVNQILDALSQIAAKGVVSMEELRQQLGDSLPGALSLAAKGLGLTEAQLISLVESGGLLADDLLPALTKSLTALGTEVDTLSASWERFKNGIVVTFQAIGDAGVITILTGAFKTAKAALDIFGLGLVTLLELIRQVFEFAGTFIGVLVGSGSISEAFGAASEKTGEMVDRLTTYQQAMFNSGSESQKFSEKLNQVTRGTAEQQAALEKTTATIQAQTAASVSQGVAAEAAGVQAGLAGKNWVQLGVELGETAKQGENQILITEKLAKAKETEGKAALELAKLTGDETIIREAATKAANETAASLQTVAEVRERDLAAQIAYRDQLIEEAKKLGDSTGARTKSIEEINKRISVLAAEAERARQSADESKNNAIQIELEAAAIQDNGSKLAEFTAIREQARAKLAEVIELEKKGVLTKKDVKLATEQAATAEFLYRDALADVTKNANARIGVIRANATLLQATYELERAQLETMRQQAIAMGDDYKARQMLIKLKELDIKVAKAKVEATQAEAQATLAAVEAYVAELDAAGKLDDVKRAEIAARVANTNAKIAEAQAGAERIKLMEEELRRIKLLGDTGKEAGDKTRDAMREAADATGDVGDQADRSTGSLNKMSEAARKAAENMKRFSSPLGPDKYSRPKGRSGQELGEGVTEVGSGGQFRNKDGWASDAKGNAIGMEVPTWLSLFNYAKGLGLSDEQARRIADRGFDAQGNYNPGLQNSNMRNPNDGIDIYEAVRREAEKIKRADGAGKVGSPKRGGEDEGDEPQERKRNTSRSTGGVRTLRLELGGGTGTEVNMASDQDARRLEGFLSQLSTAKGRSL